MFGIGGSGGEPLNISCAEAQRRLQQGATLIDVREHPEVARGMVPGCVHLPLAMLMGDPAAALRRAGIDPAAREVLCICASGGRSQMAAHALRQAGSKAASVIGGVAAWAAAGLPFARR